MNIDEIEYYINNVKRFIGRSNTISIKYWPVKPFETKEYYIDFYMFTNLYASEKLSELTLEIFFKKCDVIALNSNEYQEFKKREIRNHKLSSIIE